MKKLFIFLIFTCIIQNDMRAIDPTNIKYSVLENGMQVVLVKKDFQNIISHTVFYKVGGLDDFYGKAGLAHFLEHLMFNSTTNHKAGELVQFFDDNGIQYNASTSYDVTMYYEIARKDLLENLMSFEADRMVNLVLKDDEIAKELAVIKEERRMRVDDVPTQQFNEQAMQLYYNNNSYGQSLIGSVNDLHAIQNDDLRNFHKRYYNPKNAILVIVGDIDFDETMKLIKKHYGVLKNRDQETKGYFRDTQFSKKMLQDNFELKRNYNTETSTYLHITTAPSSSENLTDGVAADFLSYYLNQGENMLNQKLVDEMQIASDVSIEYDSLGQAGSPFTISIDLVDKSKFNEVQAYIDNFTQNILGNMPKQNEFDRIKNLFITDKIYSEDDISNISMLYGRGLIAGIKLSDINNYHDLLKSIKISDLESVATKIFKDTPILRASLAGNI
jgi:zinc protease